MAGVSEADGAVGPRPPVTWAASGGSQQHVKSSARAKVQESPSASTDLVRHDGDVRGELDGDVGRRSAIVLAIAESTLHSASSATEWTLVADWKPLRKPTVRNTARPLGMGIIEQRRRFA